MLVAGVPVVMFASPVHHRLDSEMPEGVEIVNSTLLFLRPLQRNDSGVYRCEVANDINLRSRDVRILIQGERSRHTGTQLTPIACSSQRKRARHRGYHCLWHCPSSWNVTLYHSRTFCTFWQSIKHSPMMHCVGTGGIWPFYLDLIAFWLALINIRSPDVQKGSSWAKQLQIFNSLFRPQCSVLLASKCVMSLVFEEHVPLVSQNLFCLWRLSSWMNFWLWCDFLLHLFLSRSLPFLCVFFISACVMQ